MSDIKQILYADQYKGIIPHSFSNRNPVVSDIIKIIQRYLTSIRNSKEHPRYKLQIAIITDNYYDMRYWQAKCIERITEDVHIGRKCAYRHEQFHDPYENIDDVNNYLVDSTPYYECVIYIGDYNALKKIVTECALVIFDVLSEHDLNAVVKNKQYQGLNYIISVHSVYVNLHNIKYAKDDPNLRITIQ